MKRHNPNQHFDNERYRRTTIALRLLGAVALYLCFGLLAEYAYADSGQTEPLNATHGSVWLQSVDGSYRNALLLQTEVEFDIAGMIVRAVVKQRFKNTSDLWAEAIYVFPLPENAAVDHFRLHVGERLIEGQIQQRAQARKNYEVAKSEGKRSGLIEQQRSNVFTSSLANIAPDEEISIEIEYQQTLDYNDGRYRLRFPMVVGPRFRASNHLLQESDEVTDVSTDVSLTKTNPVTIHATLDAGVALAELNSPYHPINVWQTALHRYRITLEQQRIFADRDFELVWRPALSHQPQVAVFSEHDDDYEYRLLSVMPPDLHSLGQRISPRDVVFILDVSGSMAGASIEQARAALIQALARLKPDERFNIIWFNDRTEQLYPRAVRASTDNIDHASRIIRRLQADGGTVMLPALALALNESPQPSRVRQTIFITDGNVDNESELFTLIKKQLGDNRLFTVGIGSAPNSYFMRKAARAGRGTYTYIADINEVQQKTDTLLQKLESPALVNIDIAVDGAALEIFPEPLPDLYLGEPLVVLLRGKELGHMMTLYGDYGESEWQQSVDLSNQARHPGIGTAWARAKIATLMEQHHDADAESERDAIRTQIVETSIDHHLVSRFTSLVAVDVTPANSSGLLYSEKLKTNLPHGWRPAQGQPMTNQPVLVAQLSLPQTATNAPLHLMIAAMLFALAMVFYQWRNML